MATIRVTVRFSCNTHVARGDGKTASCTASAEGAVRALARKLFPERASFTARCVDGPTANVYLSSVGWEITYPHVEPHHAA